jgi:hypothetical protein
MHDDYEIGFTEWTIGLSVSSFLADDGKWGENAYDIVNISDLDHFFDAPPRIDPNLIIPDEIIDWL